MLRARSNLKTPWPFSLNKKSDQARGLVAWYPGYPAGAGKLLDMSGFGKHGALASFDFTATSGWAMGKDGGSCLTFDGTNDAVDLGDNFGGFARFTVACWFLTTNIPGVGTIRSLVSKFANHVSFDASDSWTIHYGTGEGHRFAVAGPNKLVASGVGALAANIPYHVAGTYDGVNVKLYVNGVEAATTAGAGALNAAAGTTTFIGKEAAPSGVAIHSGWIDDVRIYNRGLRPAEVFAMVDQKTRWELRWRPNTISYSFPIEAPFVPMVAQAYIQQPDVIRRPFKVVSY